MPGASWPFTTYYPVQYIVGADGSNAASATNGFPITFTTVTLGAVTFSTLTLGTVSITGNPAVTFNTATLGKVLPHASGVSSNINSFTASALSVAASNASRRFLLFQPHCETQAWIAFATAAASGAPALSVSGTSGKNGPFLLLNQGFIPADSITLYCQSFVSYTLIEG